MDSPNSDDLSFEPPDDEARAVVIGTTTADASVAARLEQPSSPTAGIKGLRQIYPAFLSKQIWRQHFQGIATTDDALLAVIADQLYIGEMVVWSGRPDIDTEQKRLSSGPIVFALLVSGFGFIAYGLRIALAASKTGIGTLTMYTVFVLGAAILVGAYAARKLAQTKLQRSARRFFAVTNQRAIILEPTEKIDNEGSWSFELQSFVDHVNLPEITAFDEPPTFFDVVFHEVPDQAGDSFIYGKFASLTEEQAMEAAQKLTELHHELSEHIAPTLWSQRADVLKTKA